MLYIQYFIQLFCYVFDLTLLALLCLVAVALSALSTFLFCVTSILLCSVQHFGQSDTEIKMQLGLYSVCVC